VKTYHEYEPQDIDPASDDPIISFLFARVLVIGLTGFKPKPGDPADPMWGIKRVIADFMNAAQREDITIAKRESVPEVFRS
jgi:hypothetical protein